MSGNELFVFPRQYNPETTIVSFEPNSKQLAIVDENDGNFYLLDASGQEITSFKLKDYLESEYFHTISLSPDGKQLAFIPTSPATTVELFNFSTQQVYQVELFGSIISVTWSRDGKLLVTNNSLGSRGDKSFRFLRLDNQAFQPLDSLPLIGGNLRDLSDISFNDEDGLVATGDHQGVVSLWDLSLDKELLTFKHSEPIQDSFQPVSVSLSPDSNLLVTVDDDGIARLWQIGGLDYLMGLGCNWAREYLENNLNVEESDRNLCNGIGNYN